MLEPEVLEEMKRKDLIIKNLVKEQNYLYAEKYPHLTPKDFTCSLSPFYLQEQDACIRKFRKNLELLGKQPEPPRFEYK